MNSAAGIGKGDPVVDLLTSETDKKYELAARMAAAIIRLTGKNNGCLPQDLHRMGFTAGEVIGLWHMAQSLAAVEIKLMGVKTAASEGKGSDDEK